MGEAADELLDTVPATAGGALEQTAAPADADRVEHEPGERIGRHQILGVLGAGGMGRVYRAHDPELGRELAIKVLRRAGDALVDEQRLLREAQTMARIKHPNLAVVYDVGAARGEVFIAFELVDGTTLAEWARAPGRTPAARLAALIAAGRGLVAAHAAGVIHRDVKPSNVLVARDGAVKVVDFGLARAVDGSDAVPAAADRAVTDRGVTLTGAVLGTPAYMAPEQHRGLAADARADQFGFAVTAWEVLYGVRPFAGATVGELAAALCAGRIAPPPADAGVPGPVEAALRRALAIDPAERHRDLAALVDALEAVLARPARRRRAASIGVAAGAATIALAVAWWPAGDDRAEPPPRPWRPEIVAVPPVLDEDGEAIALSPDGARLAFNSTRDGELRIYVQSLADGSTRAVTPPGRRAQRPRWTRDGLAILWISEDGAQRTPLDGGPTTVVAEGGRGIDDCGDGAVVATRHRVPECGDRLSLRWLPAGGGERLLACVDAQVPPRDLRCSPDGTTVAMTTGPSPWTGDVYLVDVASGAVRPLTRDHAGDRDVTFHPDGRSILFSSGSAGHTAIWEAALDGSGRQQLTLGVGEELSPQVSPTGDRLYYSLDDTAIFPFAISADGRSRRLRAEMSADLTVGSVDGDALFFSAGDDWWHQRIVVRSLADGSERVLGDGLQPWLTPDGRELVYYVRVDGGSEVRAMPRDGGAWRRLASVDGDITGLSRIDGERAHYWMRRGERVLQQSVPLDGSGAVTDGPAGWVAVATTGDGWTAAYSLATRDVHVLAPGVALGGPARRVLPGWGLHRWTTDDRALIYAAGGGLWRYDPRADLNARLGELGVETESLAVGRDGGEVFVAQPVGQVRRLQIVNFAERPRVVAPRPAPRPSRATP